MCRILLVVLALFFSSSLFVNGADDGKSLEPVPEAKPESKEVSPLRKMMDESLDWNELYSGGQPPTKMTARVVMRWVNNTRGSEDGMTVLYLADGCPEAVCCIYPWNDRLNHEFDSLSRGSLIGKRDGDVVWSPAKPGLQFQPVPGADPPNESPVVRLRQMKALSSQFSSTMLGWRADKSDREELRRLPQPLYRYESKRGAVLDGAVFAFVQGTDPESLLLIEAFKKDAGFEWQFAFARRTSGELEARHKDKIVWHADRFPANDDPQSTHRVLSRPIDAASQSGSPLPKATKP
jgi:hypothetical protein